MFYWVVAIAFDMIDLATRESTVAKAVKHIRDIHKVLTTMPSAPMIEVSLDVYLWSYRTFRERPYVQLLCALPAERIQGWSWRYGVHPDAMCWDRSFLKTHLRYEDRSSSTYLTVKLPWERRKLSRLGLLASYHLQGMKNLPERARYRLFPLIPDTWSLLGICQGFRFE